MSDLHSTSRGEKLPTVSVLLCARNASQHIHEAITSILEQSYEDFELIVVENGSADDTWEKILSLRDDRIRSFRSNIHQLTYNLNFALSKAKGRYIARMDADDIARPDRFVKQVQFLEKNPNVGVVGSCMETFGAKTGDVKFPNSNTGILRSMAFKTAIAHPTVLIRTEVLLGLGGYHGLKFAEDLDLWLACARANIGLANLPESLLKYRIHSGQVRGRREAYASASATLFKHGLMNKSPIYLVGSLICAMKMVVAGK